MQSLICGSINRLLETHVAVFTSRGSFHLSFPGICPRVFQALFSSALDPDLDHGYFASQRKTRINLKITQFLACMQAPRSLFSLSGPRGRHVWIAPHKRHLFTMSFNHSHITNKLLHEACPRCTHAGLLIGLLTRIN